MSYDDLATFTNIVTFDAWTQTTPYNAHDFVFTLTDDLHFILAYRRYMDYRDGATPYNDAVIKTLALLLLAPEYSNVGTTTQIAGVSCTFYVNWTTQTIGANITIILWNSNNTGTWLAANETLYNETIGAYSVWGNKTETLNTTAHHTVAWQQWAQDSNGVWNYTDIQNFTLLLVQSNVLLATVNITATMNRAIAIGNTFSQTIVVSATNIFTKHLNYLSSSTITITATNVFNKWLLTVLTESFEFDYALQRLIALGFSTTQIIISTVSFYSSNALNFLAIVTETPSLLSQLFFGKELAISNLATVIITALGSMSKGTFVPLSEFLATGTPELISQLFFGKELTFNNLASVIISSLGLMSKATFIPIWEFFETVVITPALSIIVPSTTTTPNTALVLAMFAVVMMFVTMAITLDHKHKKVDSSPE